MGRRAMPSGEGQQGGFNEVRDGDDGGLAPPVIPFKSEAELRNAQDDSPGALIPGTDVVAPTGPRSAMVDERRSVPLAGTHHLVQSEASIQASSGERAKVPPAKKYRVVGLTEPRRVIAMRGQTFTSRIMNGKVIDERYYDVAHLLEQGVDLELIEEQAPGAEAKRRPGRIVNAS